MPGRRKRVSAQGARPCFLGAALASNGVHANKMFSLPIGFCACQGSHACSKAQRSSLGGVCSPQAPQAPNALECVLPDCEAPHKA